MSFVGDSDFESTEAESIPSTPESPVLQNHTTYNIDDPWAEIAQELSNTSEKVFIINSSLLYSLLSTYQNY